MRKLVSLLLALVMVLSLASVAMAEDPYTLDIYWVGNGDNEAVRAGVEAAVICRAADRREGFLSYCRLGRLERQGHQRPAVRREDGPHLHR